MAFIGAVLPGPPRSFNEFSGYLFGIGIALFFVVERMFAVPAGKGVPPALI